MKFTFSFTDQEIETVLAGLQELPAKHSIGLINRLVAEGQAQLAEAQQPKQDAKPEVAEKPEPSAPEAA